MDLSKRSVTLFCKALSSLSESRSEHSYCLIYICMRLAVHIFLSLQKKNLASEYYDTTDPFIDDSELAQDERTFFAQTKQKGFYVSSGQVALLNK